MIGDDGEVAAQLAAPPEADGPCRLVERVGPQGRNRGVIESMTEARFVRDTLEELGSEVLIAFGHPCRGLLGVAGRELLDRLATPQPWRGTVDTRLR